MRAWDGKQTEPHLEDRGRLEGGEPAGLAGRREADPTDQPRRDCGRVEIRALWHQLTEPLPAVFSHVSGLFFGFAPERPGGTLADVAMGM